MLLFDVVELVGLIIFGLDVMLEDDVVLVCLVIGLLVYVL